MKKKKIKLGLRHLLARGNNTRKNVRGQKKLRTTFCISAYPHIGLKKSQPTEVSESFKVTQTSNNKTNYAIKEEDRQTLLSIPAATMDQEGCNSLKFGNDIFISPL